jgi:hypothetical protein
VPIPILAVAGVAVVAAAGAIVTARKATAHRRFAARLAKTRVAILGRRHVGKTSLLAFLHKPEGENVLDAGTNHMGGAFTLDIAGQGVPFVVPGDLPGNGGLGFKEWKDAFEGADRVWYLFRADLIANRDVEELASVKSDLDMLADWMPASHRPKVLLIGTWADNTTEWPRDPDTFANDVADADPIKVGRLKLDHAPLIVGSLLTVKDSEAIVRDLRRQH